MSQEEKHGVGETKKSLFEQTILSQARSMDSVESSWPDSSVFKTHSDQVTF